MHHCPPSRWIVPLMAMVIVFLSACASTPMPSATSASTATEAASVPLKRTAPPVEAMPRRGAYYQDDGPGDAPPPNLDQITDAEPRVEPYSKASNKPYNVFGVTYVPDTSDKPFKQRGVGSWYGRKFHGQKTSSGELYDMYAMSAAHPTLPLPSYARVTNLGNGKSVIVRVNDRGPFLHGRVMDLSYAAALKIGYLNQGSGMIEVERLLPRDILAGNYKSSPSVQTSVRMAVAEPAAPPWPSYVPPSTAALKAMVDAAIPEDLLPTPAEAIAVDLPGASPNEVLAESPHEPMEGSSIRGIDASTGFSNGASTTAITMLAEAKGFVLQLGAFRSRQLADAFKQKVAQEIERNVTGQLMINAMRTASGEWFRVQLGPYPHRPQAENVAQQLRTMDSSSYRPVIVLLP